MITSLHHLTAVCSNAQQTLTFYRDILGLRLVKKTVNFDDPSAYHLYFGNDKAEPGSLLTFFEWPNAPKGSPGIGGTHHLAFGVNDKNSLLKWKRYLTDKGISVRGPFNRKYFESIYFKDPDGLNLELATMKPGFYVDEEKPGTDIISITEAFAFSGRNEEEIAQMTWSEPVKSISSDMTLTIMHHISAFCSNLKATDQFYQEILGVSKVKMTQNYDTQEMPHWYWSSNDGAPGSIMTYFELKKSASHIRHGAGQTHHYAWNVDTEEEQLQMRNRLLSFGFRVSPVMDRTYFKSIYTNDPDGHIVEIATKGPGFFIDESSTSLGEALKLPEWLESNRNAIEHSLTPLK